VEIFSCKSHIHKVFLLYEHEYGVHNSACEYISRSSIHIDISSAFFFLAISILALIWSNRLCCCCNFSCNHRSYLKIFICAESCLNKSSIIVHNKCSERCFGHLQHTENCLDFKHFCLKNYCFNILTFGNLVSLSHRA